MERFKNYLPKSLYKIYKEYLCEEILNEVTVQGLANNFKRNVFSRNEIDSEKATINVIKQFQQIAQQYKYERKFGKIIPSGSTHLQTIDGKFCNKEIFRKEFAKENFSEFKDKEDLAVDSLVNSLLDKYLEMYDEDGWLILKDKGYDEIKDE